MTPSDLDAAVEKVFADEWYKHLQSEDSGAPLIKSHFYKAFRLGHRDGAAYQKDKNNERERRYMDIEHDRLSVATENNQLRQERDQLKAETERLRCSFISRDEKDVQIEKLKAELRRLKELHEIRRENTQSELDRRAEIIYQANKEIGAYRAQCEKLAGAMNRSISDIGWSRNRDNCLAKAIERMSDALTEYEAFKKGLADE